MACFLFNLSSFRINESFTKLSFHFPTICMYFYKCIALLQIIFIFITWKHLTLLEHNIFYFHLVLFGWMDGWLVGRTFSTRTQQNRTGKDMSNLRTANCFEVKLFGREENVLSLILSSLHLEQHLFTKIGFIYLNRKP